MKVIRYCIIEDYREDRTREQLFARDFSDDGFMLKGFTTSAPFLRFMPPVEYAERLSKGQSNFMLFEDVMALLTDESSFLDEGEMLDLMGGTLPRTAASDLSARCAVAVSDDPEKLYIAKKNHRTSEDVAVVVVRVNVSLLTQHDPLADDEKRLVVRLANAFRSEPYDAHCDETNR